MEIFRIVGDKEQDIFWGGWLYGSSIVFSCVAVQRSAVPSSTCLLMVDTNVQTAPTSTPAVSSSVPPGSAWRARKPQPASTTKRGAPQSPHVSVSPQPDGDCIAFILQNPCNRSFPRLRREVNPRLLDINLRLYYGCLWTELSPTEDLYTH